MSKKLSKEVYSNKMKRRNRGVSDLPRESRPKKSTEAISRESNAALIRKHEGEKAEHNRMVQGLLWKIQILNRALEIMGRSAKYEVHEYTERAEKEMNEEA